MTAMSSEYELVPRVTNTDIRPEGLRLPPADRKLADLPPGQYFKLSDVARILGVSQSWLRRLLLNKAIKAPSLQMPMGQGYPMYIYTRADIDELREYKNKTMRERKRDG